MWMINGTALSASAELEPHDLSQAVCEVISTNIEESLFDFIHDMFGEDGGIYIEAQINDKSAILYNGRFLLSIKAEWSMPEPRALFENLEEIFKREIIDTAYKLRLTVQDCQIMLSKV